MTTIRAAYRYQLADHKKSILIFYCVIFALLAMMFVGTVTVSTSSGDSIVGGMDAATPIFLFIAGLCTFKEPFYMLLQNGISRKSIFLSRLLVVLTISCAMAAVDKIVLLTGKAISLLNGSFRCVSLYEEIYILQPFHGSPVLLHLHIFLFDFLMYFMFAAVGYLISLLFYRLNKAGKIAVGAGVPVMLFIVLPIVDAVYFNLKITYTYGRFMDTVLGISSVNPYAAMLTFAVSSVIFGAFTWLLLRRAPVKA